ncbi:MAG: hypothetical protein U0R80_16060 [Nocardioidaceae bacterium]
MNEAPGLRRLWLFLLVAAGLAISLAACGSQASPRPADETAGDLTVSTTSSPPNADAPTYANCQDLSKVFNSRDENQLSYLPEEHWLIVSPSSTTHKIDLVNDI